MNFLTFVATCETYAFSDGNSSCRCHPRNLFSKTRSFHRTLLCEFHAGGRIGSGVHVSVYFVVKPKMCKVNGLRHASMIVISVPMSFAGSS